jgi:hypothetical protein
MKKKRRNTRNERRVRKGKSLTRVKGHPRKYKVSR